MSSSAVRYHARAPRYVLRPGDHSFMRFASSETRGETAQARVRDLSATGLSFFVQTSDVPDVGDLLKIEFAVPGRKQIAWFATVVRIEERGEWDPEVGSRSNILVAIKFQKLPAAFRQSIQQSIKGRVDNEENPVVDVETQPAIALACLSVALFVSFAAISISPAVWISLFR